MTTPENSGQKKLLIVDDDAIMRTMIGEMLEDQGLEIIEAGNGDEALEIASKEAIDIVISDMVMPKKNGLDLVIALKKDYPKLKIICISGGGGIKGRFDYLPIAKLIGANMVLQKPFTPAQLRETVQKALEI